jgi:hypothetical protein
VIRMLLARRAARSAGASFGTMWQAVRTCIQGRQARLFEQERRTTLLTVPQALAAGTRIVDRRADGSVLVIEVPLARHMEAVAEEDGTMGLLFHSPAITSGGQSVTSHLAATAAGELEAE